MMDTLLCRCKLAFAGGIALAVCWCVASPSQAGLRAYWPLDEGTGLTAADLSGHGNDGTLVADTEAGDPASPLGPTAPPEWITGVHGGALLFSSPVAGADPNYNHVAVPQSASLTNLGTSFSIALWIRQDSLATSPGGGAGYQRLLSTPNYELELGTAGDTNDYFWPYATENAQWQKAIGTSHYGSSGTLGEWFHMAVVSDGTNIMKYINGAVVPSSVTAVAGTPIFDVWTAYFSGSNLKLGSQSFPNKDWFHGALDEVAIWGDQALTASQVAGLYNGTLTPLQIVPEPGGLLLAALALLGVISWRQR